MPSVFRWEAIAVGDQRVNRKILKLAPFFLCSLYLQALVWSRIMVV